MPTITRLRTFVRTRKALFEWVYGENLPFVPDLLWVRLPSAEKRKLVGSLRQLLSSDMPWLSSKLVHAMAFRPDAFGATSGARARRAIDGQRWGPLYSRIGISKGTRRRTLFVPNPALMRVQRGLLALVGPSLERALLPGVFGAKRGVSGPTFLNAARHLGKHYVATFDLESFFPSVRIDDVIRGLQLARDQGLPMLDAGVLPLESRVRLGGCRAPLAWTDDAIVLVARLATRHSRLPQGAPMSPLLASVAFTVHDHAILHRLGAEFGTGGFSYSRYFDDLTVSLSADAARRRGLQTAGDVLARTDACIRECLMGSSFRLNARKSRCSSIAKPSAFGGVVGVGVGHHVTGLVVRSDSVSLPRSMQRHLRTSMHKLDQQDFVATARSWSTELGRGAPEFESVSRGHRWRPSPGFRRNCSAERLAALMLRRLHPDIRVRAILKDWFAWQATVESDQDERRGRGAQPLLEWVLAVLWSGGLAVRKDGENSLVFSHQGTEVCAICAESPLAFFLLSRSDAVAVAEYWHHLNGLAGYLGSCPDAPEFSSVRRWREELMARLRNLSITEAPAQTHGPEWTGGPARVVPIRSGEALAEVAGPIADQYRAFERELLKSNRRTAGKIVEALSRIATNEAEFEDWVTEASELIPGRLPKCLPEPRTKGLLAEFDLPEYLRIRADVARRRVRDDYAVLSMVESALRERSGLRSPPNFCVWQREILDGLSARFRALEDLRHGSRPGGAAGTDRWAALADNPHCRPPAERLAAAAERLGSALDESRSSDSGIDLLCTDALGLVSDDLSLLCEDTVDMDSQRVWRHLGKAASALWKATGEVLEPRLFRGPLPADAKGANSEQQAQGEVWKEICSLQAKPARDWLQILKPLRNRDSHSRGRADDLVRLNQRIADLLGKMYVRPRGDGLSSFGASAPGGLLLTGYEAMQLKAGLVQALDGAVRVARDRLVSSGQ